MERLGMQMELRTRVNLRTKVRAELGNVVEGVKVEPEEVKAEPGNVVERVKVKPEEAKLPLFRRKCAQNHNSEADSQGEPKLKKKKVRMDVLGTFIDLMQCLVFKS